MKSKNNHNTCILAIVNYDSMEFQQFSRAYTYSMPQGLESVNKNMKENTQYMRFSTHSIIVLYSVDITGGTYSSKGLHREVIECSGWHYNKPA